MSGREVVFILEPDAGRVTVESSNASLDFEKEMRHDLGGRGVNLNCGRPAFSDEFGAAKANLPEDKVKRGVSDKGEFVYLYRLYHRSTVDGPGRRSVVQFAGCSIRCPGCYVPETHERENGRLTSVERIVTEIEKRSGEHDGVSILGGEPFDQPEALLTLVRKLKEKNFHLVIYTGFTLEELLARNCESTGKVLENTDLLIDGPFKREFARGAGEYRGSGNQRMILNPFLSKKNYGSDNQCEKT